MGYNEILYLAVFLPLAAVLYRLLPEAAGKYFLLAVSWFYFYLNSGKLLLILIAATVFVYIMAGLIQKAAPKSAGRKAAMGITVGALFGMLIGLKYTGFFIRTASQVSLSLFGSDLPLAAPKILVPVGISYYTLEAAGYILEVYWGRTAAEKSFCRVGLFLGFFPQTLEGPIARWQDTAMQFPGSRHLKDTKERSAAMSPETVIMACLRILWGMCKKLIVADRLNTVVHELYTNYASYDGVMIAVAAVTYALQLYMEFSGMMDVVIGSARLFGIRLPENFRQPFFAQTASEFWRRWHITLGVWLKTYVFYPVTTSRTVMKWNRFARKKWGRYAAKVGTSFLALAPVWLFNGLWHGPQWNYIFYGIYYLVILMIEVILEPVKKAFYTRTGIRSKGAVPSALRLVRTWLIIFTGEMFFRADGLRAGLAMFRRMFQNFGLQRLWDGTLLDLGLSRADWAAVTAGTAAVLAADLLREKGFSFSAWYQKRRLPVRWCVCYTLIFVLIIFGAYGSGYQPVDLIYKGF